MGQLSPESHANISMKHTYERKYKHAAVQKGGEFRLAKGEKKDIQPSNTQRESPALVFKPHFGAFTTSCS